MILWHDHLELLPYVFILVFVEAWFYLGTRHSTIHAGVSIPSPELTNEIKK